MMIEKWAMHQEFDSRSIAIYWGQGGKLSYGDPLLTEMKRSGTPHARQERLQTRDSLNLINPISYFGYVKRDDLAIDIGKISLRSLLIGWKPF